MYDAIVLGPLVIKYSLLIILGSFLIVYLIFRLISPFDQNIIKLHLNTIVDLLILTVFVIIGAKALLNIRLLLTEPFAVLSYPSDANALYIASLIVILWIGWLVKKQKVVWRSFFDSLTRFLIFSHFITLFGMTFFSNQAVLFYQLAIHFILLIVFIVLGREAKDQRLIPLIVAVFGFSQAVLGLFYPVVFFGYYVEASYYILIGAIGLQQFYLVNKRLRGVKND